MKKVCLLIIGWLLLAPACKAQTDTLRVMAYNVLYYGDTPPCQGAHSIYHNYLKTIVDYAQPDILGLEKMATIPLHEGDSYGSAPAGFQDSVLQFALNADVPGHYACCPFTNNAMADNIDLLFYNQSKLGFVAITNTYSNITDFNTYKLYYKDPNLATTHDTTFLYITLNHDESGDGSADTRTAQITGDMASIETHFTHLPNMINMGDFNTRNTSEGCYQALTFPADTNFRFYEPVFYPDASLSYPADWSAGGTTYEAYYTTSTRLFPHYPNSCGTSGGGKAWYDHMFISPWLAYNANYIQYIPYSYKTVGNDGHRAGVSINDTPTNTSVPADVLEALFQMSNKYPVMASFKVTFNTTGTGPADPETGATVVSNATYSNGSITIANPVSSNLILSVKNLQSSTPVTMECIDMYGRLVMKQNVNTTNGIVEIPCNITAGNYVVRFYNSGSLLAQQLITKQ